MDRSHKRNAMILSDDAAAAGASQSQNQQQAGNFQQANNQQILQNDQNVTFSRNVSGRNLSSQSIMVTETDEENAVYTINYNDSDNDFHRRNLEAVIRNNNQNGMNFKVVQNFSSSFFFCPSSFWLFLKADNAKKISFLFKFDT